MPKQKKEESRADATTGNAVSVLEQLQKNSARKGGSRIKARSYEVNMYPIGIESIRLAPQAIGILGLILMAEKLVMTESEIFDVLEAGADQISSKQTPWKVFQYYRKPLVEAGFLTEKVVTAATTDK